MTRPRAHLIANAKSGKGHGAPLPEQARKLCEELGYELVCYDLSHPSEIERQSRRAVGEATKDGGVLIAAGGDGTIRTVAQAAHGSGVRFAVIPCGTFNFFARAHGIPEDPEQALRLALTGDAYPVRLGSVNGNVFLINASLGIYAKAIREREINTARFGRKRAVVVLSSLATFLGDHNPLRVELVTDGKDFSAHTAMIFIGNNALQLRDLSLNVADCMKQDRLAVVMMKPATRAEMFRIFLRGILKTLEDDQNIVTFCADHLAIHTRKSSHLIALDGENLTVTAPLRVEALPAGLHLIHPPQAAVT